MSEVSERDLLRLVRGELPPPEAAALRRRLAEDPELAVRERRLAASWDSLTPPPDPGVPPGFAWRVLSRAREERESGMSWTLLPAWGKLVSALALAVGLAAGFLAGAGGLPTAPPPPQEAMVADDLVDEFADSGETLAETYLDALEREPELQ